MISTSWNLITWVIPVALGVWAFFLSRLWRLGGTFLSVVIGVGVFLLTGGWGKILSLFGYEKASVYDYIACWAGDSSSCPDSSGYVRDEDSSSFGGWLKNLLESVF